MVWETERRCPENRERNHPQRELVSAGGSMGAGVGEVKSMGNTG